jgi:peptidoglycan/LPS O-acetylase OafA/YrhL
MTVESTIASPDYSQAAARPVSFVTPRAHYPGLDGLRGIAVISVIVFHTLWNSPSNSTAEKLVIHAANVGWIGVDLFFVLSGFLITGILLDERESSHFFRTFYTRRVLRIVPVYAVFLLFTMWLSPAIHAGSTEAARRLVETQAWYWAYLVNVFFATHGFGAAAQGTSHLWSLSVEEQFYLLWPLAVAFLPQSQLPRLAIACVFIAELCRIAIASSGASGEINYALLPTRMDTLAVGGLLACAVRDRDLLAVLVRWRRQLISIAIVLVALPLVIEHKLDNQRVLDQVFAYPGIAALCGFAVMSACETTTWLSSRWLRFFGRYSYGMYIWHVAVLTALGTETTLFIPKIIHGSYLIYYLRACLVLLMSTTLVSIISWYAIEHPFLRLKRFARYA